MATINGTTGRNASHWKYYLVVTEQNVDVSSNISKVKVDVYLGATSYSKAVRGNISATHTINIKPLDKKRTSRKCRNKLYIHNWCLYCGKECNHIIRKHNK